MTIILNQGSENYTEAFSMFEEIFKNQLHIVLVYERPDLWRPLSQYGEYSIDHNEGFHDFVQKHIDQAFEKFCYKSLMVSMIGMWKANCIKKEEFEIEYGITNTDEDKKDEDKKDVEEERDDYTVGEDLETFIKRIKNGEITKESIPKDGEYKDLILLCLLDKKERKKLDLKDSDYLETFIHGENADVPEEDWATTEYKHLKFSKSIAFRRTYVIGTEFETEHESLDEYLSLLSETSATVVSEHVNENDQKIVDYGFHTDNDSSVVNGESEGRSVRDEPDKYETEHESSNELSSLLFETEQIKTECDSTDENDNDLSVVNEESEYFLVQNGSDDIISSGTDDDVENLVFDDCEIFGVAVHNFQMNESTVETFYALLYVDGSRPNEPELPLAYISLDFVKRVLKTPRKPMHVLKAMKWLKGVKTQRFISLADQFADIDDSHIKLVANEINKRPNSHFETSSHILELRDIQVRLI